MFCTIFLALYWLSGRSAMEKDANKQTIVIQLKPANKKLAD